MSEILNDGAIAAHRAWESVPWRPKSLELLRKQGRAKVLHPLVVQRMTLPLADYDKVLRPSDGLYYCMRFPLGWYPLTYRFDDLPELDHSALWQEHVAPVLACLWAERLGIDPDQLER